MTQAADRKLTTARAVGVVLGCVVMLGCGPKGRELAKETRWDLFDTTFRSKWQDAKIPSSGELRKETDGFSLLAGRPMTGMVLPAWEAEGLPLKDYAINYEAKRVIGNDFFGSVTFPVEAPDRCVTFVLGGWGGSQVGISCIDGYDASENTTGSSQKFDNNRWYTIRIEVRSASLQVWLDGRPIINTNIAGRQLSLRSGDIDRCMPFGFATYGTEGRLRNLKIEPLPKS